MEARFQGKSVRTIVAEGPNPAWNQQLKLSFVSPNNDYSAETLGRVKVCLQLTVEPRIPDHVSVNLTTMLPTTAAFIQEYKLIHKVTKVKHKEY